MKNRALLKRYFVLTIGLLILACGVSLTVKAGLGISPISSLPYVFSVKFKSVSLGTFTFISNMIMIFIQIIILKKEFKISEFLQIPISIVFGFFIDMVSYSLRWFEAENYLLRLILMLSGCLLLAVGITVTCLTDVALNPGEAIVKVIAKAIQKEFGHVKVAFDLTLVLLTTTFSLIFFRSIVGIREGTLISACCLGFVVKFMTRLLKGPIIGYLNKSQKI